ncbi:hypothetical protein GCM10007907_05900 [Chitinimonas prasina]|uniref:Glycoside hydrolase family 19 catalytic domain-containing protein n=1 Tax=Chitinimonas prasina TaxID=1434937 RepID=A0ABQ5YEM6_9NEIS|nr:hypothetical protein [Chitinimonas prasina]GLR11800.1 hypothetical protein GCM10007907_05900 [Chitinimonas prasina]
MPWDVLGLAETTDERAIRRAYAARLKQTRPEDDAAGFVRLREAYEHALGWSRWQAMQAQGGEAVAAPEGEVSATVVPGALAPADELHASTASPAAAVSAMAETRVEMPAQPTVRTVWQRDAGAPRDQAREALRQVAFDRDMGDEQVLGLAEEYGWLGEAPRTGDAPMEWLARARSRCAYIHAQKAVKLIAAALEESESRAVARFELIVRASRWESLDGRDMLKQVLANWLRGRAEPPMLLLRAVIDWAGWLDDFHSSAPTMAPDEMMLCLLSELVALPGQTVAPAGLLAKLERLCHAAFAQELDPESLLLTAREDCWLDPQADWTGWPQSWLSRAGGRVYQLCAQRMQQALEAADRQDEVARMAALRAGFDDPAWVDGAARHAMAERLATLWQEESEKHLLLWGALARWAGWQDADGQSCEGLSGAAAWLCGQLDQERVWQRWCEMAAAGARQTDTDAAALHALLQPMPAWRQHWLAGRFPLQLRVRHVLAYVEQHWPALFARIAPERVTFWRRDRLSLQGGWWHGLVACWLPAILPAIGILTQEELALAWRVLLWLATMFVLPAALVLSVAAVQKGWRRLTGLHRQPERQDVLARAARNGFGPLSVLACALLATFVGTASLAIMEIESWLALAFAMLAFAATLWFWLEHQAGKPAAAPDEGGVADR